jgi:hypothetical protein
LRVLQDEAVRESAGLTGDAGVQVVHVYRLREVGATFRFLR